MKKRSPFEIQLMRLSLVSSVPLLLLLLAVMIWFGVSIWPTILVALVGGLLVLYSSYHIYMKAEYQFRSLSNLLDAMIGGEYSMRAVSEGSDGALDELVETINGLAERLSKQKWEASENQLLVNTIIEHIDVAIVALTSDNKISFLNPAAKKLLSLDQPNAEARLLEQLATVQPFTSGYQQVVELSLGRQRGRFNIFVEEFRKTGKQHKLLFISDVTTMLRMEERKAWQSLVRVISHEINNSLSPIASISQTLGRMVKQSAEKSDQKEDLLDGLQIIAERANGLSEFVRSYREIAKLPEPDKRLVSVRDMLNKVCALFTGQQIVIAPSEDESVLVDPIQFEQVLINLIKNAVEAMSTAKAGGVITVSWQEAGPVLSLIIEDEGSGVQNPDNLFVPFFSTKKNGSGIGLVLCRQILEAHDGSLSVVNRDDAKGCRAIIEIPTGS